MVEVTISSAEFNQLISWYNLIFGPELIKPTQKDVYLMRKLETMRDATILDEMAYNDMIKKR
mgnify:CR=1 FL=1